MRIILDTNVFISGVFFNGPPYKILEAWRDGRLVLVVSPDILEEYYRVGENLSSRYQEVDITPVLEFVTINAEIVSTPYFARPICTDPDDDKFFICAIAARCPVIVSGDKHLLSKSGFCGVRVRKPRDFMDKLSHTK